MVNEPSVFEPLKFYHSYISFDLVWQHTFVSPSAFSRRAVVSYWRKYVHEVLVNRLGGLSLPRKSVVRLTDRPDMTLDVYRGRKTTKQQSNNISFELDRTCTLYQTYHDKAFPKSVWKLKCSDWRAQMCRQNRIIHSWSR